MPRADDGPETADAISPRFEEDGDPAQSPVKRVFAFFFRWFRRETPEAGSTTWWDMQV